MGKSSIEWTDATWNPTIGCQRVSPGCGGARGVGGCYAEKMAARIVRMGGPAADRYRLVVKHDDAGKPLPQWNGVFLEQPEQLVIPLRGDTPTAWFVDSMSDLFGKGVSNEFIAAVFGVASLARQSIFQILTKRAERLPEWFAWVESQVDGDGEWGVIQRCLADAVGPENIEKYIVAGQTFPEEEQWPLPNVWLGASVEDQQRADERIPHLLRVPAAVRFLSVEPLLEAIDIETFLSARICTEECADDPEGCDHDTSEPALHWCIVGGESGHGARQFSLGWARSIVEQCQAAGVACFVKQFGANPVPDVRDMATAQEVSPRASSDAAALLAMRDRKGGDMAEWPEDLRVREWPVAR